MRPRGNSRCKIAPSILSADFARLAQEVEAVDAGGCDWIHVDVMDGHFVPQITVGPGIVKAVKRATDLPLDVHLMIDSPEKHIEDFALAGASIISVHQEACPDLPSVLDLIRQCKSSAAVAINPETELEKINHVLEQVDMVLVMSVQPGRAGQAFIDEALDKIRQLAEIRRQRGYRWLIEVDGGIKPANAAAVALAGADVLVAGSAIFGSEDYAATIRALRA